MNTLGRQMNHCESVTITATNPLQMRELPRLPPPTALSAYLVGRKRMQLSNLKPDSKPPLRRISVFSMMPDKDEETCDRVEYVMHLEPFGKHRVRIVVTYRHYHELLVSAFHERIATRDVRQAWSREANVLPCCLVGTSEE